MRCQACLVLLDHPLHLTLRTFRCWQITIQVPNLKLAILRLINSLVEDSLAWQKFIAWQKILARSAVVLCESNSTHFDVWKRICWECGWGWRWRWRYGYLETTEEGIIYCSSFCHIAGYCRVQRSSQLKHALFSGKQPRVCCSYAMFPFLFTFPLLFSETV